MWKNKPPFRLCLNSKAAAEIHWHCEHYKGRGVMQYFENGQAIAKEGGFPYANMEKTMAEYNAIAAKMAANEPGAPYDASSAGQSSGLGESTAGVPKTVVGNYGMVNPVSIYRETT